MGYQLLVFKTIDGSSYFQVVIFNPHYPNISTSSRICLCDTCGTCDLFKSLKIYEEHLKKIMLQSTANEFSPSSDEPNSFYSVQYVSATDRKSTDIFQCVKIEREGAGPANDDYSFVIRERCNYMQGRFLEKVSEKRKLINGQVSL